MFDHGPGPGPDGSVEKDSVSTSLAPSAWIQQSSSHMVP
jgi:hypothetical protein